MMKKFAVFCYLIYTFSMIGCTVVAKREKASFEIKDAYYQSWMVNENEKGTNIILELTKIQPSVTFDSIVFRGNKLPVALTFNGDTAMLTGILNFGIERISMDKKQVNLPDQLIYRNKANKYTILINSFRRKESKFLK